MGKNWLSAGRVQTVALRLIVEREKEIQKFSQEEYYQIYGEFGVEPEGGEVRLVKRDVAEARQYQKPGTNEDKKPSNIIKAKLIKKDDVDYEIKTKIELFDGEYTFTKTTINKDNVDNLQKDLQMDSYTVSEVKEDITKRYPPPPFTTSLLQQEAFQKYGFSSKMTMRLAQNLYERGLITYHRTDSFSLSTQFVFRAKDYIEATYGKEYALEKPRGYKNKSKSAQEAHEAIRPTHLDKPIDELFKEKKEKADGESSSFTQHHRKLYELIFNRAVATQMKEADIKVIKMYMKGAKGYLFEAEHQEVIFDGFLRVLNPDFARAKLNVQLKQGQSIPLSLLQADASLTKAPPRYNEASLIKTLEEKGIGRPSTYAPIISLIQDKYYVEKESRYFTPTKLGTAISDYLSEAFPQVFNLNFTAQMEEGLDEVANGNQELVKLLTDFYEPFEKVVDERKGDTKVIDVEEDINETCPNCGSKLTVRFSKFGKFMACSNYPNCKFTKPFLTYVNNKFCPDCKGRLTVRYTKSRKRFYGCENYPKCKFSTWALKDIK
jgi:DNA topoisomerase-1